MTISKAILVFLGVLGLIFGAWGGSIAFEDTSLPISTVGMMGMLGYAFHSAVIFASLGFPVRVRKVLTLPLLVWHIPEAILIATVGMGISEDGRAMGIAIHAGFSALALLSWYLAKNDPSPVESHVARGSVRAASLV